MCQYSSIDGMATDWHIVHLGSRAVGGAGLVICEATAVSPEGRITPHDAGLWNDEQIEPLIKVNRFIKEYGAVPAVQLAHAGRKASASRPWEGGKHIATADGGYDIIGPTDQPFSKGPDGRLWKVPRQMEIGDIERIQQAFVSGAKRALEAGYEVVELHAAHGYLLHSFFSPLVNTRDDQYGGSLENRARMLRETARAVRAVWPERLPLVVRLSASDWVEGGLTIQDSIQLAIWLKAEGVDVIDVSSGGASEISRTALSGSVSDQIDLADQIKHEANIQTMAVGAITDAHQAEGIIQSGKADFALLARELLRDPYWPMHAAQALNVNLKEVIPAQNEFWVNR